MNAFSRRNFIKFIGATASLAAVPMPLRAQLTNRRVVVIGGGFGGAATAKFLRLWAPDLEVVLIEPNPNHVSCIMSNLLYVSRIQLQNLTISYDGLRGHGGERRPGPGNGRGY